MKSSTNIVKATLYISIAVSLSSCANMYVVPPNTPKATLSIYDQNIFTNNHQLAVYQDPVLCKDPRQLGDREFRYHGESANIQANKLITILDHYSVVNYDPVDMVFSFYPQANQHYVIMSSHDDTRSLPNKVETLFFISKETFKNGKYSETPVLFKRRKLKAGYLFTTSGDCADGI